MVNLIELRLKSMKSPEASTRKDLESRLKRAFPKQWKEMSEEDRQRAVDNFYNEVLPERIKTKELLSGVYSKNMGYGLFLLAALLAIFGGLVVNILDRYFVGYGGWYRVGAPAVFFILLYSLIGMFEDSVNQDYRDNDFLNKLLKKN